MYYLFRTFRPVWQRGQGRGDRLMSLQPGRRVAGRRGERRCAVAGFPLLSLISSELRPLGWSHPHSWQTFLILVIPVWPHPWRPIHGCALPVSQVPLNPIKIQLKLIPLFSFKSVFSSGSPTPAQLLVLSHRFCWVSLFPSISYTRWRGKVLHWVCCGDSVFQSFSWATVLQNVKYEFLTIPEGRLELVFFSVFRHSAFSFSGHMFVLLGHSDFFLGAYPRHALPCVLYLAHLSV